MGFKNFHDRLVRTMCRSLEKQRDKRSDKQGETPRKRTACNSNESEESERQDEMSHGVPGEKDGDV
jgi:hypothetical protein